MSSNSYLRVLSLNVYGQIYYVITVAFCTLIHIHLELVMLTRYLPRSIVAKRLAAGKIVSPFQTVNLVDDFEAYAHAYTRDIRSDLTRNSRVAYT